jgi:MFS superfamily sulfate permease-like transporter
MSEEKNQENKNEVELEPEDVDIESLNKLGKLSLRKISNEILNTSEGEEKENFEKLLETGDEEKVVSYIEKNYPELLEEKNEETQDDLEFLKSEIRKNLEEMKKSKNQNE